MPSPSQREERKSVEGSGHTPGPWRVYHAPLRRQFPGSKIIEVQSSDGLPVVTWSGFDNGDRLKKTHLANARLIAAAPAMLAVLKMFMEAEGHDDFTDVWPAARTALKKAGEKL